MSRRRPDMGLLFAALLNNLFYLASLGGLVFLLCMRGTTGSNRFGDEPGGR